MGGVVTEGGSLSRRESPYHAREETVPVVHEVVLIR